MMLVLAWWREDSSCWTSSSSSLVEKQPQFAFEAEVVDALFWSRFKCEQLRFCNVKFKVDLRDDTSVMNFWCADDFLEVPCWYRYIRLNLYLSPPDRSVLNMLSLFLILGSSILSIGSWSTDFILEILLIVSGCLFGFESLWSIWALLRSWLKLSAVFDDMFFGCSYCESQLWPLYSCVWASIDALWSTFCRNLLHVWYSYYLDFFCIALYLRNFKFFSLLATVISASDLKSVFGTIYDSSLNLTLSICSCIILGLISYFIFLDLNDLPVNPLI